MKTDIQIAQEAECLPIGKVAEAFGIDEKYLEYYGRYKAKIDEGLYASLKDKADGKLILVTAVNPTPAGEGKSTTTIGLAQALNRIGKKTAVALREPSLGPCMGVKGGATGGGYSQVLPMEEINLHFTGDIHAMTTANNLLAAMIDNHIYQGNVLNLDPRRITWKRAMDMNDRELRNIVAGLGGKSNGVPREDGFIITVASEIMAIVCLSEDIIDLKERLGKIIVGYTYAGEPVTAKELNADGAMAVLLKDAIKPNLCQTLENTPAIIHGGPFANIAHGCNSIKATRLALKLGDYAVTEAGFGADLGAEKFFDIKCRIAGLKPAAAVIVATARALKYNGGVAKSELTVPNSEALEKGMSNLVKHIENLKKYGLPIVVTLNSFATDTPEEIEVVKSGCERLGVRFALSEVFAKGGEGGVALAEQVIAAANEENTFKYLYPLEKPLDEKIAIIAKEIYGADGVIFAPKAKDDLKNIKKLGFSRFPVCIAKTQYSFSDNPSLLGRPEGFKINVRELRISAGAGFCVAITGDVMTMPGLPPMPAACNIDIDEDMKITGLF